MFPYKQHVNPIDKYEGKISVLYVANYYRNFTNEESSSINIDILTCLEYEIKGI